MKLDFHAHILPGCDHGSRDMKTSLKQLELAKEAGVEVICATPHFYPNADSIDGFLKRRTACAEEMNAGMPENMPKVLLGAEVLICDGADKLDGIENLRLEGTKYLLIEMPFFKWGRELVETVRRLNENDGIIPVLAHADRYPKEAVEELIDMGIQVQLNAESLCRIFRGRHLRTWIEAGNVFALGSDIHGTDTGYRYWNKSGKIAVSHGFKEPEIYK